MKFRYNNNFSIKFIITHKAIYLIVMTHIKGQVNKKIKRISLTVSIMYENFIAESIHLLCTDIG
jgi:hypothetical protein